MTNMSSQCVVFLGGDKALVIACFQFFSSCMSYKLGH